jgi:hypothetical protein
MYRDLKEQAPVEVDSILGDLIERGRKQGSPRRSFKRHSSDRPFISGGAPP